MGFYMRKNQCLVHGDQYRYRSPLAEIIGAYLVRYRLNALHAWIANVRSQNSTKIDCYSFAHMSNMYEMVSHLVRHVTQRPLLFYQSFSQACNFATTVVSISPLVRHVTSRPLLLYQSFSQAYNFATTVVVSVLQSGM